MFLLFVSAQSAFSSVITGIVSSELTGAPIEAANVTLCGTTMGASTDNHGKFKLDNIPGDDYEMLVSHVSYEPVRKSVSLSENETLDLHISLSPANIRMKEFVYTATRTKQLLEDVPVATEVITRRDIEQRAAQTAAEALESNIGLHIRNDFAGSGLYIQGIDPSRILVLVDGNRTIGKINGSIDLSQISSQNIQQIEVVKGAVSTLYGSEAIGGVVNIITSDPLYPLKLNFDFSSGGYFPGPNREYAGSDGFKSLNYMPAGSFEMRHKKLSLQGSIQYNHRGLVDLTPEDEHTNGTDETDRWNAGLNLGYELNDTDELEIGGRFMDESKYWIEDAGLTTITVNYDVEEENQLYSLNAGFRREPGWVDNYHLKLYRSQNEHVWRKRTQKYGRVKDFSENKEIYTEATLQFTKSFHPHKMVFGGDIYWWKIDARSKMGNTPADDFSETLNAWDGFIQNEWNLIDRITLVPGVRFEQHEVYGIHWSPRLSAMWTLSNHLKLRTSAGLGYRAPSPKELRFTFNHSSAGYIVLGNPDLEPEESRNISLNLEYSDSKGFSGRFSLFDNDLKNLIDFSFIRTTEEFYLGIYQYKNFASARTRGAEFETAVSLVDGLNVNFGYAYLESRDNETGTALPRRSKHIGQWSIEYKRCSFSTRLWGGYTGKSLYSIVTNENRMPSEEWTPAYILWNAAASFNYKWNLIPYLKVGNLLNYVDTTYGPWRGRTVTVGLRWSYVK